MTGSQPRESRGPDLLDSWVASAVHRPKIMLALWALLLIAASVGLRWLRVETSGESILDRTGEDWAFYRDSVNLFGNDEVIVAAIEAANPYDPSALRLISDVSRSLETAPGVRRVDSISTFPIVEVLRDGSVRLDPAIDATAPLDRIAAERAGARSGSAPSSWPTNNASFRSSGSAPSSWPTNNASFRSSRTSAGSSLRHDGPPAGHPPSCREASCSCSPPSRRPASAGHPRDSKTNAVRGTLA